MSLVSDAYKIGTRGCCRDMEHDDELVGLGFGSIVDSFGLTNAVARDGGDGDSTPNRFIVADAVQSKLISPIVDIYCRPAFDRGR